MPASTRTRRRRSTSSTRSIRSSESSVPSVGTPAVNECPEPATRTVRPAAAARSIAAATSPVEPGCSIALGSQLSVPAQLTHAGVTAKTLISAAYAGDHAFHADDIDVTPEWCSSATKRARSSSSTCASRTSGRRAASTAHAT